MTEKKRRDPPPNLSEKRRLGIPDFNLAEKLTSVLPVKVQPSLKRAVKQVTDNASEFARLAIIERLSRMSQEEEESFG